MVSFTHKFFSDGTAATKYPDADGISGLAVPDSLRREWSLLHCKGVPPAL